MRCYSKKGYLVASISLLVIAASNLAHAVSEPDVRVARYTTLTAGAAAAQTDPLKSLVSITFPRTRVESVGQAVSYLLLRTGYRLVEVSQLDPKIQGLLQLPLPEVHRNLGPLIVHDMLAVLVGGPFVVAADPLTRQVAFRIADTVESRSLSAQHDAEPQSEASTVAAIRSITKE